MSIARGRIIASQGSNDEITALGRRAGHSSRSGKRSDQPRHGAIGRRLRWLGTSAVLRRATAAAHGGSRRKNHHDVAIRAGGIGGRVLRRLGPRGEMSGDVVIRATPGARTNQADRRLVTSGGSPVVVTLKGVEVTR